ncbi:raffinose synthase or seed imbibition protein Sip1-domain-containing protein, partial [Tribonema minus]
RPIVRGSDDFYPRDPASHGTHIYANAFNALLLAHCGTLQDWDMFQTSLGAVGAMHAAARAISGGPVYISDRPGEHDAALIRKMVLEDGSVPRARRSALPTLLRLFVDAQVRAQCISVHVCMYYSMNPARGHGVVGIFNVYGSRWDQRARAYRWVRGHEAHRLSFTYTAAAEGTIRPSDCHALLRQEIAGTSAADVESGTNT